MIVRFTGVYPIIIRTARLTFDATLREYLLLILIYSYYILSRDVVLSMCRASYTK